MLGEKSEQVTHDEIVFSHSGKIGEERLDSHIRDDHNDPHRAALEDIDPNQKGYQVDMGSRLLPRFHHSNGLSYSRTHCH